MSDVQRKIEADVKVDSLALSREGRGEAYGMHLTLSARTAAKQRAERTGLWVQRAKRSVGWWCGRWEVELAVGRPESSIVIATAEDARRKV